MDLPSRRSGRYFHGERDPTRGGTFTPQRPSRFSGRRAGSYRRQPSRCAPARHVFPRCTAPADDVRRNSERDARRYFIADFDRADTREE
jgi:hypothetical protein